MARAGSDPGIAKLLRQGAGQERRLLDREQRAERRLASLRDDLRAEEGRLAQAQARVDKLRAKVGAAEATLRRRQEERAAGPSGQATAPEPIDDGQSTTEAIAIEHGTAEIETAGRIASEPVPAEAEPDAAAGQAGGNEDGSEPLVAVGPSDVAVPPVPLPSGESAAALPAPMPTPPTGRRRTRSAGATGRAEPTP